MLETISFGEIFLSVFSIFSIFIYGETFWWGKKKYSYSCQGGKKNWEKMDFVL